MKEVIRTDEHNFWEVAVWLQSEDVHGNRSLQQMGESVTRDWALGLAALCKSDGVSLPIKIFCIKIQR